MNNDPVIDRYEGWNRKDKDGHLFFAGVFDSVLKRHHEGYEENGNVHEPDWNETTTHAYIDDVNDILECCPVLNEKIILEITSKDYEAVQKELRKRTQKSGKSYAVATFMHWIYLIRITAIEAERLGQGQDKLYGTFFETPASIEKARKESLKKYKSLTPYQEIKAKMILETKILDAVSRGECVPGDQIGLFITLDIGCRPGELCGIRYGREYANEIDPSVHELELIETNVLDSRDTKPGGKTANAPRKIPISDETHTLIGKCRLMVKKNILDNWEKYAAEHPELAEAGHEGLDDYINNNLYIACSGTNIFRKSIPGEIAAAARELFKIIGFEGYYLYLINIEMDEDDHAATEYYVGYKEPTCYLLRRNFASQLSFAGFLDTEIEYLMGHVIVDDIETRNKLSSPEHILEMARRMKKRPLFAYKLTRQPIEVTRPVEMEQISGEQEYLFTVEANDLAILQIATKEPREILEITIETDTDRPVIVDEKTIQMTRTALFDPVNDRPVDMLDWMYNEYRKAEKKVIADMEKQKEVQDNEMISKKEDPSSTEDILLQGMVHNEVGLNDNDKDSSC